MSTISKAVLVSALVLVACSTPTSEDIGSSADDLHRTPKTRPAPAPTPAPTTAPTTTPTTAPTTTPPAPGATCTLTSSGPIVVTQDGAIIQNLHIVANGKAGIDIQANNVVVRNVAIEHSSGVGISVGNSSGVTLENVDVSYSACSAQRRLHCVGVSQPGTPFVALPTSHGNGAAHALVAAAGSYGATWWGNDATWGAVTAAFSLQVGSALRTGVCSESIGCNSSRRIPS